MIRGLTVTLLVALAIFSALLTAGGASARADYRWPRWEERDFVLLAWARAVQEADVSVPFTGLSGVTATREWSTS
jgi:hypothetical protein